MSIDIDDEWKCFLSCGTDDFDMMNMIMNNDRKKEFENSNSDTEIDMYDVNDITNGMNNMNMNTKFKKEKKEKEGEGEEEGEKEGEKEKIANESINTYNAPLCTDIYISTKTKIAYLSLPIDLKRVFWLIPVIQYSSMETGVVKKQMKFNSTCQEELDEINEHLKKERLVDEFIITSINNTNIGKGSGGGGSSKIKFKDNRKISIGLCKKDIMTYKRNPKAAFFNCFVIILRLKIEETDTYKEFHIKLFNTGKIELPGIQNDACLELILKSVLDILRPYMSEELDYKKDTIETVLINSNFNCGYYVNRSVLCNILKYKYHIECSYDSCNYPGIQCKFYFNPDKDLKTQSGIQSSVLEETNKKYQNVKTISFMIFRTGSVLIVGKCDEDVLYIIYDYLKDIFKNEYSKICQPTPTTIQVKNKVPKLRKKTLIFH
jgi:hypothetical protein